MKVGKKHYIKILALLLFLIVFAVLSLSLFPKPLDFSLELVRLQHIVAKIRLPEILIAIVAGACLGLSGSIMQINLDNPLASPFTLGISSAAACGASFSIILNMLYGMTWLHIGVVAFCFSMLSVGALVLMVSIAGISQKNIVLIGMSINFFFSSANTLLEFYAPPDVLYQITVWTTGSLTTSNLYDSLNLFLIFSCSLIISILFSNDMSILLQGESTAIMHGVNVSLERIVFLAICSLLASYSVSIVGIIGFIGLIAPHICRLIGLESPKVLLLSSSIMGSLLLVIADIISTTAVYPLVLPISAVTSFFGIPFLLILLFARKGFSK